MSKKIIDIVVFASIVIQSSDKPFVESNIDTKFKYIGTCIYFQCIVRGLSAVHAGVILYLCSSTRNCHSIIRWYNKWHFVIDQLFVESLVPCVGIQIQQQVLEIMRIHFTRALKYSKHFSGTFCWVAILAYCTIKI